MATSAAAAAPAAAAAAATVVLDFDAHFKDDKRAARDSPVKARLEARRASPPPAGGGVTLEKYEAKLAAAKARRDAWMSERAASGKAMQLPPTSRTPPPKRAGKVWGTPPKASRSSRKVSMWTPPFAAAAGAQGENASSNLPLVWTTKEPIVVDVKKRSASAGGQTTTTTTTTTGQHAPSPPPAIAARLEARWRDKALSQSKTRAELDAKLAAAERRRAAKLAAVATAGHDMTQKVAARSPLTRRRPRSAGKQSKQQQQPLPPVWNQCAFDVPLHDDDAAAAGAGAAPPRRESPAKKRLESRAKAAAAAAPSPYALARRLIEDEAAAEQRRNALLDAKAKKAAELQKPLQQRSGAAAAAAAATTPTKKSTKAADNDDATAAPTAAAAAAAPTTTS